MRKGKHAKKTTRFGGNGKIVYRTAGILLVVTLLSVHLMGGLYAKYTHSASASDAAQVAAGLPAIELKEHKAVLTDGIYVLNSTEVAGNTYERVIPGVDIAKDPFVRLSGTSEVSYALYVKVEEKNLPSTVTYKMADGWSPVTGQAGVYQYTGTITSNTPIYILQGNKLTVSEKYVDSGAFSLNFSAWIEQID